MDPTKRQGINQELSAGSTRPVSTTAGRSRAHQARLLIGEANKEMRAVLASSLRREGYQVVATQDAIGLLDLLEVAQDENGEIEPFDAVVVDVALPGQSRHGILPQLRRIDEELPLVVMSSDDGASRGEAFDHGADAVLDKPLDLDALRTVLRILVAPVSS